MEYIQISSDKFLEYDAEKNISNFVSIGSIQSDIDITTSQIASLSELPSDKFLLAWAKENYTNPDLRSKETLETHLSGLLYKKEQINSNRSYLTKTPVSIGKD